MKRKQITAILMSAIMTVSACMPMNSMQALAAENADASGTAAAVVEEEQADSAQDTAEVEEPQAAEPETPAPAVNGDESGEESGNTASTEGIGDSNDDNAEDASADTSESTIGSTEAAPGEGTGESAEDSTDSVDDEDTEEKTDAKTSDGQDKDIVEEAEEETTKKASKKLGDPEQSDFDNAAAISSGDVKDVSLNPSNPFKMYRFTPESSGSYEIYSFADGYVDTCVDLFDETHDWLVECFDGASDGHFRLTYYLEQGNTYYYRVRMQDENDSGNFSIALNKRKIYVENRDQMIDCEPGESVTLTAEAQSDEPITYSWSIDDELIDCTDESYTFVPEGNVRVCCTVESGNEVEFIYFFVNINSYFFAEGYVEGYQNIDGYYYIDYGQTVVLRVEASSSDESGLTYEWYKDGELIENAAESSLTTDPVNGSVIYFCNVSDQYGNNTGVSYSLAIQNNLQAYVKGKEGVTNDYLFVSEGESVTLEVTATADDMEGMEYHWEDYNHEYDEEHPEKYTGTSYTIESVGTDERYDCRVTDKYGTEKCVSFYINPENFDNHLYAYIYDEELGEDTEYLSVSVEAGENVTLEYLVYALDKSDLTCEWYYEDYTTGDSELVAVTEEPKYVLSLEDQEHYKAGTYRGIVKDQYGNESSVEFNVNINNRLEVWSPEDPDAFYGLYKEVEPGESLELRVRVNAEDMSGITYRWFLEDTEGEQTTLEEGTLEGNELSYVVSDVENNINYVCSVEDAYGNTEWFRFIITVKANWKAYPAGAGVNKSTIQFNAAPEESLTLKVNVKGNDTDIPQLTYEWTDRNDDPIEADEGHPDQYTIDSVTESTKIYCNVRDQYGNYQEVEFDVKVDSGLTAYPSSTPEGEIQYEQLRPYNYVYVPYGGNVTLKTNASTKIGNGELSYEWLDENAEDYMEEYASDLELSNVTRNNEYRCTVQDAYGNQKGVYFRVFIENHLAVYPQNEANESEAYILAKPGTEVALHAIVHADDTDGLKIQWNTEDWDDNSGDDEDWDDEDYDDGWEDYDEALTFKTLEAKNGSCSFGVKDKYGNTDYAYFEIEIDNGFEAYPRGAELDEYGNHVKNIDIQAQSGEDLDLKVVVKTDSGARSFSWSKRKQFINDWGEYEYNFDEIGDDEDTLSITVDKSAFYNCHVTDAYGNSENVTFNILVGDLNAYPEGAEMSGDGSYSDRVMIIADQDEAKTLRVLTEAAEGAELTYDWTEKPVKNGDWEPAGEGTGNSQDSLAITASESKVYRCAVSDQYGNNKCVYFYVYANGIELTSNLGAPVLDHEGRNAVDVNVKYGSEIDLKAIIETDHPENYTYDWRELKYNGSYYSFSSTGDHDDTFTVVGGEYDEYRCDVADEFGNEQSIYFIMHVDNELTVRPEGADEGTDSINVQAQEGEDLVLKVLVSALDTKYFDYKWIDSKGRLIGKGKTCPVHVTEDGTYKCVVKDGFDNEETAYFRIVTGDDVISIADAQVTLSEESYVYDGTPKTPDVTVTLNGAELAAETDYTVEYQANTDAGTAKVVVRGCGNYIGTVEKTFEIVKASQTISAQDVSVEVGGTAKINVAGAATAVSFASGDTSVATVAADGTVTGKNVGTAAITVTAVGNTNYEAASTTVGVTVTAVSLENEDRVTVTLAVTEFTYNGEEHRPGITVMCDGRTLAADVDYVAEFGECTTAGEKTVTISGIGNYTGSVTKSYTIKKASQTLSAEDVSIGFSETAKAVVTGAATSVTYESQNTDVATVTTDGTVTGTGVGTATITVTAASDNNYELAVTTFTVTVGPVSLSDTSKVAVSLSDTEFTYNSSEQKPVITVVCNGAPLTEGEDYEVAFSGESTNAGEYSVTVTGKGNYDGSVTENYRILKAEQVLVLSTNNLQINQGDSAKIEVTGAQTTVTYTSQNDSVAAVAADGTVTGVGAGETTITVAAAGNENYEAASKTVTVTVAEHKLIDLNQAVITLSQEEFTYDGSAKKPGVTVTVDGNVLSDGFTVSYRNNIEAWEPGQDDGSVNGGAAKVGADAGAGSSAGGSTNMENAPMAVITGDGEITTGVVEIPFVIHKAEQSVTISAATVSLDAGKTAKVTVTGGVGEVSAAVEKSGFAKAALSANTAEEGEPSVYTITITGSAVGSTKLVVAAAGDRNHNSAVVTCNIKVRPKATTSFKAAAAANGKGIKLTWAKVAGATNYVIYRNGKMIKTVGNVATYTDTGANTNGTKYTFKVYAKAATGTSKQYKSVVYYKLNRPATPTATNSASKKMTVKWAKNAKANGYQIQYALKSNYSGAKIQSVSKNSIVSKVIGSLTKGKIYYVRVRSFKKVSGKTYYSAWSATRKIKITK